MDPSRNRQPPSPRLDFTLNAIPAPYSSIAHGHSALTAAATNPNEHSAPLQPLSAASDIPLQPSSTSFTLQPGISASTSSASATGIGQEPGGASRGGSETGPSTTAGTMPSRAENGPSRKQNVACDACRAKKIRCRRTTIAENCEQCSAKGAKCTSNYVEQLQAKAKKVRQGKGTLTGDGSRSGSMTAAVAPGELMDTAPPAGVKRKRSGVEEREDDREQRTESTSSQATPLRQAASLPRYYHNPARPPSDLRPSEKQANLVRYMLSPTAVTHHHLGYSDLSSIEGCEAGFTDIWEEQGGRVWSDDPSEAHAGLTDVGTRELADDLVDTFSTVVHPRFPLLDLSNIRARLASPDTHPDGPVPHNLLAVAIAFGGRFSDHSIINHDREECMTRDETNQGRPGRVPPRSRLVQLLVVRAREVVEVQKTHRIGSLVNVQVLTLLEYLVAQSPFLRDRYTRYNFTSAVRHVEALGYSDPKTLAKIPDEKEKTSAVFTYWYLGCSDGFQSVLHRLQPAFSESRHELGDFDVAMAVGKSGRHEPFLPNGTQQSVAFLGAASAGSKMCRQLCADLWHPRVPDMGIPLAALETFINACSSWRDNFLSQLGVPSQWPNSWNFDAAITACSTDAYYHALWLVVERAIKDFGIAELRATDRPPGMVLAAQIEVARKRIREEAAHGALRITSLTSTLALNQYLRLDPLILHQPIYEAGMFLADQAREECMIAVVGLRQYCIPYPQLWARAEEIEWLFRMRQSSAVSSTTSKSNSATLNKAALPYAGGSTTAGASIGTPHSGLSAAGSYGNGLEGSSSASNVSGQLPLVYATLAEGSGTLGGVVANGTNDLLPETSAHVGGTSGLVRNGAAEAAGEGAGGLLNSMLSAVPGDGGGAPGEAGQQEWQKDISMALFEWLHAP